MKRFLAIMVALGVVALAAPQEASAHNFYRGGSGFSIGFGTGGFGGFGPGGFGPYGGFGGFPAYGFRPAGVSIGYSSFRPAYSYGRSYYRPSYSYGYRGGRSCGGW
jgi:hypothetical protein